MFTQGPWYANDEGDKNITDSLGNHVASTWDSWVGVEEAHANMQLIAAAPELLATLQWIKESAALSREQIEKIEQTINLATGEIE